MSTASQGYICFSLEQLNLILIDIQTAAVQREGLFGWELAAPCVTALLRAWLCLCCDTSENASRSRQRRYFCTAVKPPLASQANAVSLFRAQATEVLRLQQAAPRNRGKDRGVFPLRLQTSFGCSRKRGICRSKQSSLPGDPPSQSSASSLRHGPAFTTLNPRHSAGSWIGSHAGSEGRSSCHEHGCCSLRWVLLRHFLYGLASSITVTDHPLPANCTLSRARPLTGDCLVQGWAHITPEALLHSPASQHPLKSHGFP